jgi:amino acid transporter
VHVPYWVLSLAFIALIGVVVGLGVIFSTRAEFVWMLAALLTIVAFSVVVIVRVLSHGTVPAAAPLDVSSSPHRWLGVFWGMLFGGFIFAGFESVQNVAEETRNPRRVIPLAMVISICVLTVYFLLVSYATAVGFGMDSDALAHDPNPLLTLAGGAYGAPWLQDVMSVMLLVDILSMAVGMCLYARGGVVALARDGRWPSLFARVNRRGTPVLTTAIQLTWMVVVLLITHFVIGPLVTKDGTSEYLSVFRWSAGFEGLTTMVVYGAICLGGLAWLRRKDTRPILLTAAAILGLLSGCGAVYAIFRGPTGPTLAGAALIVALLVGFFIHSTIQLRRGTYAPSLVRREEAEAETGDVAEPEMSR